MPLDFMTANHIGGQGGGFEPQRTNQMQLIITGLDGQSNSRDDVLTLSAASFPIPKVSSGVISIGYLNEKRKFPGNPEYESLTWVFHDYVDKDVAGILWRWRQLVHDPVTGKGQLAAVFKKTAYLKQWSPDGNIERQYRIEGCWPSQFDPGESSQDGDEDVKISITIEIDKFYPEFAGIKP